MRKFSKIKWKNGRKKACQYGYCPHLNKIETLWRKVKYEWLKPRDYLNWDIFNQDLDDIFTHIGQKFTVKF